MSSTDRPWNPASQSRVNSEASPSAWQYTSVRLQVERITASSTPGCSVRLRSAATTISGPNVRRSRMLTGAVVWLSPMASSGMAAWSAMGTE